MKDRLARIFKTAGFTTDRTVHIKTSTRQTDLDVCALHQEVLLIIECKTGTNIKFSNLISEWDSKCNEITKEKASLQILGSIDGTLTKERMKDFRVVRVVIAFREYEVSPAQINQAAKYDIEILDPDSIEYYERTSAALGKWTKYEIFREMKIKRQEEKSIVERQAFRVRQPGTEFYVFTMAPHQLLRIAYVFRRSLKQRLAYQRMVNARRVEVIGRFFRDLTPFLPNAILLAFEENVGSKVSFKETDGDFGTLSIPMEYCSAWVVDGQHRLYGFTRTPYSDAPQEDVDEPRQRFDLLVVGLKGFPSEKQAKTFVEINDNQKRIDPTLLCDLSTVIKDLRHPLTWPSLIAKGLNERDPWKNKIRIFEVERNKPITLVGFAKWALLRELLGRKELKDGKIEFGGPLYRYEPFDYTRDLDETSNKKALDRQIDLLCRYFSTLKRSLDLVSVEKWTNVVQYGITKTTGVNASLLVLNRLLERDPQLKTDLDEYLKPLGRLSFKNSWIVRFGGGWDGFKRLANRMILELNRNSKLKLKFYKRGKKARK